MVAPDWTADTGALYTPWSPVEGDGVGVVVVVKLVQRRVSGARPRGKRGSADNQQVPACTPGIQVSSCTLELLWTCAAWASEHGMPAPSDVRRAKPADTRRIAPGHDYAAPAHRR